MSFFIDFYSNIKNLKFPLFFLFYFSLIAYTLNALFYQFPGNSFLHFNSLPVLFFLFINLIVLLNMLDIHIITQKIVHESLLYFIVCALIIFGATAIQYTPFDPIDAQILALEKAMHIDLLPMVIWTQKHPLLHKHLSFIYSFLELEMLVFPIYAIALKKFHHLHEYFFLVLITTFFGFMFYYFFPTTGPASNLPSTYFLSAQVDTGLKFWQIHHYQQPTTTLGGLIVMPSFHVIWAWLSVYLIRFQPLICSIFVVINLLLTCSCVLLGWHYFLDIVGSFILLGVAFFIHKRNVIRSD